MALIKCRECGHLVSDQAVACPNCGCPASSANDGMPVVRWQPEPAVEEPVYYYERSNKDNIRKWLIGIIVALVVVLVCGGMYYYSLVSERQRLDREKFVADSIAAVEKDSLRRVQIEDSIKAQEQIRRAMNVEGDYRVTYNESKLTEALSANYCNLRIDGIWVKKVNGIPRVFFNMRSEDGSTTIIMDFSCPIDVLPKKWEEISFYGDGAGWYECLFRIQGKYLNGTIRFKGINWDRIDNTSADSYIVKDQFNVTLMKINQ